MTYINWSDTAGIEQALVGRRIVAAEMPVDVPATDTWQPWQGTLGMLTLDDGTKVYVGGNDGGCSCGAGDYVLTQVATTDNIITAVKVEETNLNNNVWTDEIRYSLFVFTGAKAVNVAQFEGDDGNGYYGTGFHLLVQGIQGEE